MEAVRRQLALATHDAHMALHNHDDIGLLMSERISHEQYMALIGAYAGIYEWAENSRCEVGVWQQFSIASSVHDLRCDTGLKQADQSYSWPLIRCPAAILGMLYVLHGAGFGGKVIAKQISKTLPDAPLAFFSTGTQPELWRQLCAVLENFEGDQVQCQQIIDGALHTFNLVDQGVSTYMRERFAPKIAG